MLAPIFLQLWRLKLAFQVTIGIFVDAFEWFRTQMFRRRISVATNSHRSGRENSVTVWQTIENSGSEEFGLTPIASHRDRRGWRYAPQVWGILGRVKDDRSFAEQTAYAIEALIKQIRWMIANPPLAVTEKGAVRSEYRPETIWQEMGMA